MTKESSKGKILIIIGLILIIGFITYKAINHNKNINITKNNFIDSSNIRDSGNIYAFLYTDGTLTLGTKNKQIEGKELYDYYDSSYYNAPWNVDRKKNKKN